MQQPPLTKVIDLTPYWKARRRERLREMCHTVLACWTQYMSLLTLALYAALRVLLCPQVAIGCYSGPLAAL